MLVFFALALVVLLGFCGLAVDVGTLQLKQLRMQNAADAAALAAMLGAVPGPQQDAGRADASLNGFTDGANGTTVTVDNPPKTGLYAGNSAAYLATIAQTVNPAFFSGARTVTAQATALAPPSACIYLLSTTYQPSFDANGETSVASGPQISANCAFYMGRSYHFNTGSYSMQAQFLVAGTAAQSASSGGAPTPAAIFNSPITSDPLSYLSAPAIGPCVSSPPNTIGLSAPVTLYPGTYCGGLSIRNTGGNYVTFMPGTYVITGDFFVTNSSRITGTGVTFYLTQGGRCEISNTLFHLTAPTSGALQGIVFFTDRTMPTSPQYPELLMNSNNPGSTVDGIFYLPGQQISASSTLLQGNNYLAFVADSMSVQNTGLHPSLNFPFANPLRPTGGGLVQ